jgi:hypothetical protein
MAFAIRDLSVLAYANGFTLWHYKSGSDPLARVREENYFADASDMMAAGDMIMVSSATYGASILSVVSTDMGTVLTNGLADQPPSRAA